jgi:hypothetical protein
MSKITPKTFNVTIEQNKDGFRIKAAQIEYRKNNKETEYRRINARVFTRALRNSRIIVA